MTKEQKVLYQKMLNDLTAEYKGQQMTAVNEAVKLNKLVQICCGVAYDTTGAEVHIPATNRISLTKDVIESAGGKVIVFVPLTGALESVAAELRKHFTVEVIHGGTSANERNRIFNAFQNTSDPRVLVANAGTMSHGLTLTAANTIIWFAPPNSNEVYNQANARITRPGQTRNQLIVHIEGTSVEQRIYDRLEKKTSMQGVLLDMIQESR
jgi:SNF2 family DNA or RNA helicase